MTVDRLFSDLPAIRAPGHNVTEMPIPTVPTSKPSEQLALNLEPLSAPAAKRGVIARARLNDARSEVERLTGQLDALPAAR